MTILPSMRPIAPFDFVTDDSPQTKREKEEMYTPIMERRPHRDLIDGELQDDTDTDDDNEVVPMAGKKRRSNKRTVILPPPPAFQPLSRGELKAFVNNHEGLSNDHPSPATIFRLYFNDEILNTIVKNTNMYAITKNAGSVGRAWTGITSKELLTWMALTIYQGFHCLQTTSAIWNKKHTSPAHSIAKAMAMTRYHQIKRFLHISPLDAQIEHDFDEVEPLLSHIRDTSKCLYTPATDVLVDEVMVRFTNRSFYTHRPKNVPTPEGFKIFSLRDSGYTFTFLPLSQAKPPSVPIIPGFNTTERIVYHLIKQLPTQRPYNVFMNNYFSSIRLFQRLRDEGYGTCGMVRNQSGFPKELQVDKSIKLDWDTRSGVVVGGVLAVLWQDNNPISMLTTIHGIIGNTWEISRERCRPRETSTNSAKVRAVFGTSLTKELKIPKIIDDYNHIIGGIEVADQLRSYHTIHQPIQRQWMSLFFWLLETAIVNSYIIARCKGTTLSHSEFRERLIWEILEFTCPQGMKLHSESKSEEENNSRVRTVPQVRVTKNFRLPASRFINRRHPPEIRDSRATCRWCSWKAFNGKIKVKKTPTSQVWCATCDVPLCVNARNCFAAYHTMEE